MGIWGYETERKRDNLATQAERLVGYCMAKGIRVIVTNESHTSKCSFLDLEPVCHHGVYAGQRVKRSLFRTADGHTIHADVNASYNILRKVIPDAFAKGTAAVVVQPMRVYPRANVKAWV